jgi:hypothetical protein
MTARHCFHEEESSDVGINDNFQIIIGHNPQTSNVRLNHRRDVSGAVILRVPHTNVGVPDYNDMAQDLALVRLDTAVHPADAVPRNPSLVANVCDDSGMAATPSDRSPTRRSGT